MHSIQIADREVPISISYSLRRRTIGIKVKNQEIMVTAPSLTPKFIINNLLKKKRGWIERAFMRQGAELAPNSSYYLGKEVKIDFRQEKIEKGFVFEQGKLVFCYKENIPKQEKLKFLLLNWYKIEAQKYIQNRVLFWQERTGLQFNKVFLKNTRAQWGSCSTAGNLSFSLWLIACPAEVVDYVIIHELCHLKQMNHSDKFWDLVKKFKPNYKKDIKWQKEHNFLLNLDKMWNLNPSA